MNRVWYCGISSKIGESMIRRNDGHANRVADSIGTAHGTDLGKECRSCPMDFWYSGGVGLGFKLEWHFASKINVEKTFKLQLESC